MMKKIYLSFLVLVGLVPFQLSAWEGMPTPPLHVEGNQLKDPTGKSVLLHGWMQPTETWFNGGGRRFSNPTNWTSEANVAGMLNFLKDAATVMSDTTPRYGQNHGWYASFVRINTDHIGGWTSESGLVNPEQFDGWINNFLVPYVEHLKSRGLYLVLCATGPIVVNVGGNDSRNTNPGTQERLLKFWSTVANAPGIKNADNVMFELMNEPVAIETVAGNGNWGHGRAAFWEPFQKWMQPIIDTVRSTGANNVIWVPTLGWQGEPHGWVQYPFTGTNIGIAAHLYPAYGGGVHNDHAKMQTLWNNSYKPAADIWPMIITEMMWFPYEGTGYDNLFRGTTEGFGNAARNVIDTQGNVSYLVGFLSDLLVNLWESSPEDCTLGTHEGAQSYFQWLPEYSWAAPDDGTPGLLSAFVGNDYPNQIHVIFNHAIDELDFYQGFKVSVDNQIAEIDHVIAGDNPGELIVILSEALSNENEISVSYADGDVVSIYEKSLNNFDDIVADNLIHGASPRLVELTTSKDGDLLLTRFNMEMQIPTDLTSLNLKAEYEENIVITILQSSFHNQDSTILAFTPDEQIYADYQLYLSYSGNNIISAKDGLLKVFDDLPVKNMAQGLPIQFLQGSINATGDGGVFEFSKNLAILVGQKTSFTLKANGRNVPFRNFYALDNTIRFTLSENIYYDDVVTLNYAPGNVTSVDKGVLEAFSDIELENHLSAPQWQSITDRIQAENYYLQYGTDTEPTGDVGGGRNVGWIDSGDWLLYAIENDTSDTEFEIFFRVASPNSGRRFTFFVNNQRIGQVNVPHTGGWQVWQTVAHKASIDPGKHYLKIVSDDGGFNINYFDIKKLTTGLDELTSSFELYPNPASDRIFIKATDFQFNRIEIIDLMGSIIKRNDVEPVEELQLPVELSSGVYFLRISNPTDFRMKKFIIKK
jgi:hypothetical protein